MNFEITIPLMNRLGKIIDISGIWPELYTTYETTNTKNTASSITRMPRVGIISIAPG